MQGDGKVREDAPGVFRLVLPLGLHGITSVNAYLLADPAGATLVDCGIAAPGAGGGRELAPLTDAVRACGLVLSDVRRLVITHAHVDHYGLAGEVVRATGAELWMHVRADAHVARYRDLPAAAQAYREMLAEHGMRGEELEQAGAGLLEWAPAMPSLGEATTRLRGGESFAAGGRQWEVVPTPGHSPGHVCLWSAADGLLISGDHLLPGVVPPVTFERGLALDPLGAYLASLERIGQLAPATVLPGHDSPFPDGARRAHTIAGSKRRRLAEVLRILRAEPLPAAELATRMYGTQLRGWRRSYLTTEVLAYLAHHDVRGAAYRVRRADGVQVWHALEDA
ncbi:MAG: MBL fold metallo-hydrolase [Actinomycetota bacterium]|nr:MBL fold metallo-hydrolase [Actinomycetota bacterium]